jgi:hypothetical protein
MTPRPHYKGKVLIEVVESILPISTADWEKVAEEYQTKSGEVLIRDVDDLKRHWTQKLTNNGRKPTGKSGDKSTDNIYLAQQVEKKIFNKREVGAVGDDQDGVQSEIEDDEDNEDVDDDEKEDRDEEVFGPGPNASTTKKRVSENPNAGGKTKNSRNSGGSRGGNSRVLQNIGESINQLTNLAAGGSQADMMQMMFAMQQQSNQQMMQMQQQNMMMMAMVFGRDLPMMPTRTGNHATNSSSSSSSNQASRMGAYQFTSPSSDNSDATI